MSSRTRVFSVAHEEIDSRTGARSQIGAEFRWHDSVGCQHVIRVVTDTGSDEQFALYYRAGDVSRGSMIPREAMECAVEQMRLADKRESAETSFHGIPQEAIDEVVAAGIFAGDPRVASSSPIPNAEGTFGWLLARRRSQLVNEAMFGESSVSQLGLSAREEYVVIRALDVVLGELADAWARRKSNG